MYKLCGCIIIIVIQVIVWECKWEWEKGSREIEIEQMSRDDHFAVYLL